MAIHELTIGMYARTPDTFAAAYDDGTAGPHRGRREDAERDYLGRRHVLALDTRTGGSVLAPWLGPDALPQPPARNGSTIATREGVIIAQTTHHTLTY